MLEKNAKQGSYPETELAKMAGWLAGYWLQRGDSRNQAEFAKQVLGISQPAFNQILKGVRPVPEQHFVDLCKSLAIPGDDLFAILVDCPAYRQRIAKFLLDAAFLRDLLDEHYEPLLVLSKMID